MHKRFTIAVLLAALFGAFAASAHAAPDRPPTPPPTDFWQDRHNLGDKYFLNMAHQGGEVEAPASTLYAFDTAIKERGADTLEMDGYVTQDGKFVITHDFNPNCLSNIMDTEHAGKRINQLTLNELKTLDFAHWFLPGPGHYGGCNNPQRNGHEHAQPEDYIYRGIALGEKPAPEGYVANDFKIPTLEEVLDAFPDTPMNIDLKNNSGAPGIEMVAAEVVAEIMNDYPERSEDVIIASFTSEPIAKFHELAPGHKALSAGEDSLLSYIQGNPIVPTPVAAQPPDVYNFGGNLLATVPILKPHTDHDGFAIHVWPRGDDSPEVWQTVLNQGADGFFTQEPSKLHEFLCEQGIPRPDGSLRCPEQQCPEGFTGWAPDCEPPVCPEGTEGTYPDCQKVCPPGSVLVGDECQCPTGQTGTPPACKPVKKATVLTKVVLGPKKAKLKAGKKLRLKVRIQAKPGDGPNRFRVNLRSSNRQVKLPKSVVVKLNGRTGVATVTVRATRNARGKAKITARSGKFTARANLTIKKQPKKKKRRARR